MSKEDSCNIDLSDDDNCSTGTCAPVSPFSKEGIVFLIFLAILVIILFYLLYLNGYI